MSSLFRLFQKEILLSTLKRTSKVDVRHKQVDVQSVASFVLSSLMRKTFPFVSKNRVFDLELNSKSSLAFNHIYLSSSSSSPLANKVSSRKSIPVTSPTSIRVTSSASFSTSSTNRNQSSDDGSDNYNHPHLPALMEFNEIRLGHRLG